MHFIHPHFMLSNGKVSRCTIAYTYDGGVVRMAASFCSPKEKFVKATGRQLAIKRFDDSYVFFTPRKTLSRADLHILIFSYIEMFGVPGTPAKLEYFTPDYLS